jgi:hypothetical protein
LNLFRPSPEALEHLANACDPATFGKNDQDVYDESYWKAGKLSAGEFSMDLDVGNLIKIVRNSLLCGMQAQKPVRAELYNLNVYGHYHSCHRFSLLTDVASGEKSFFKAHIDTPRSERMFGSLVVFFPTTYEGGSLIMRQKGEEWSFDAANVLAEAQDFQVAYVALYSDVEHEVSTVTSGYRVSVTYNLYFDDDSPVPTSLSPSATSFKSELETLLLDPTFLPDGGVLGFDLEHYYPVQNSSSSYVDLKHVGECLKGTDAEIMAIAKELSLPVSVWGLIHPDREGVLLAMQGSIPGFNEHQGYHDDFEDVCEILTSRGAKIVGVDETAERDERRDMRVNWVTQPSKLNQSQKMYAYYGNSAEARYTYNSFCLFVEIGKPGMRSVKPELVEPPLDHSNENEEDSSNEDSDY